MLAVLDVVEWQTVLDFETGKETAEKSALAAIAREPRWLPRIKPWRGFQARSQIHEDRS